MQNYYHYTANMSNNLLKGNPQMKSGNRPMVLV